MKIQILLGCRTVSSLIILFTIASLIFFPDFSYAQQTCPGLGLTLQEAEKKQNELGIIVTPELAKVNGELYGELYGEFISVNQCVGYFTKQSMYHPLKPNFYCQGGSDMCPNIKCTYEQAVKGEEKTEFYLADYKKYQGDTLQADTDLASAEGYLKQFQQCISYFNTRGTNEVIARDIGKAVGVDEKDVVEIFGGEENVKKVYDKNCVIATASYGSPMAKEVQMLREIRDNQLLKTQSGATFMDGFNAFYYSFAPTVAYWEQENPAFKEVVKVTITPLITSLSLLNYVNMDSEAEVLTYGISMIMLNIGMYFAAPIIVIWQVKKKFEK